MDKQKPQRERLIRTAMQLFRQRGYASTGLRQILKESGAPKGSLYYYFPEGKESLGAAAVKMAGELMLGMLSELAAKNKSAPGFVKAYCRQMAIWMEESNFKDGSPVATTVLETVPDSATISEFGNAAIDSWIKVIASVFERDGMTPKQSTNKAQVLVSAVEGSLILARLKLSKQPILNVARWFA